MTPFFSIISPTLQRPSLQRLCDSVNAQSPSLWQHIIIVDSDTINERLLESCTHPQRMFKVCGTRHGNFGNRCRYNGWESATGTYLWHVDDDNYISDPEILSNMATTLAEHNYPDWATFPILRHGSHFFHDPPRLCYVDTMNVIVKREIGRWPDIAAREADGHWAEALRIIHPNYVPFPAFRPIGVMEYSSNGV